MILYFVLIVFILIFFISLVISIFSPDPVKLANDAEKRGDFENAIELYKKILLSQPDNHQIRWKLATIYAKKDLLDKEAETLEILLKNLKNTNFKNELEAHLRLASYYHSVNKMENFFLEIKKVLFFNPGHEESLLFLAMLYAANDMYSNAINSFTKILQADPENREALFYSALCCLSLNEKEKGEALLNSLLSITPEDSDTLTILGYLKKPVDIDKAIDFFKGAIKSETGFDLMDYASLFYAVCLMKKGEYDTAYQELSKLEPFSESKPLDYKSELYFSLAWAAHKNGKPVLSEKWWEKLVGFNFTYLDLFGQYKIHNLLSFEMVNKKWNDMFKNMTIPALKLLLARYKGLNIKNMESEFDNWSLGKRQKGKGKIKNVTCYTIEEFINLNFNELLSFSKKIIETMSYRVDTEIDNKSGYDCITQPDLNGNCHYVQIRNWNSIVSDVPIKELYNLMEKKNVPKGILVTSGTFTQKAQKAAMDLGISLIDKNELKTLMF